ncbi:MAG: AraC family transcriptional regulator [Sphingobium sp.]|nr:AraC family transcriptional regulator [Sphingobium sp.]
MDPLSDILSLIKPRSYSCAGFDVGGDQCTPLPEHEGIVCYAMLSGEMWLSVEPHSEAIRLKPNDCVVLPSGRPVTTATDLGLLPMEPDIVMQHGVSIGDIKYINGGGKCFLIACYFEVDRQYTEFWLQMLSPVVHVKNEEDKAVLRWALDRMRLELHDLQPGGPLIVEHLAHLILVQALRLHLKEAGIGWLSALGKKEVSLAIKAMHENPARRWTVDSLAKRAGMSRANFAARFKEAVGITPLNYLRRWRMLLAGHRLTTTTEPVSQIALSLGYESESAFSMAFKNLMGISPRRYGRRETSIANERPFPSLPREPLEPHGINAAQI